MYTICAHCDTRFRIHSEQLKAAQGLVRCAQCNEVFNALDNLHDQDETPPDHSTRNLSNETNKAAAAGEAVAAPQAAADATASAEPSSETQAATEGADTQPQAFDPDLPPAPASRLSRLTAQLFWGLSIGILVLLCLAQLAWFNRDRLLEYDRGRQLFTAYCDFTGCEIPPRKALDRLKIIDRLVASHPDTDGALRIHLSFVNQASFHQPFPLLQVSLFSREGELEAQRRFGPEEYAGIATPPRGIPKPTLNPGQEIDIQLDVIDPGPHVTSFEFAFF